MGRWGPHLAHALWQALACLRMSEMPEKSVSSQRSAEHHRSRCTGAAAGGECPSRLETCTCWTALMVLPLLLQCLLPGHRLLQLPPAHHRRHGKFMRLHRQNNKRPPFLQKQQAAGIQSPMPLHPSVPHSRIPRRSTASGCSMAPTTFGPGTPGSQSTQRRPSQWRWQAGGRRCARGCPPCAAQTWACSSGPHRWLPGCVRSICCRGQRKSAAATGSSSQSSGGSGKAWQQIGQDSHTK